ncbi:MAG TPA: J domain-containing protein [Pyrinomonadaceae bacterium]|nr:J domain-containing protein [Pyrinomonadaceae bacterium]
MATYYETLKVTPKAGSREIKSAYRKLARKLHPDRNNGSEETARAFAAIAEAYEVLRDPVERSKYDRRLLRAQFDRETDSDSIFASSNAHARRWRQMVYEHRYNEIIDRMMAEERRESLALQKIIFPTVALFVSALAVGIFKPQIFANSAIIGKIIVVTLFIAGVIHLIRRIREAFEKYTYNFADLHDSIFDDNEIAGKPYSRFAAGAFLASGFLISLGVGILIGNQVDLVSASMPFMFSARLGPEFLFYPPIFVLFVDLIHSFAFRADV